MIDISEIPETWIFYPGDKVPEWIEKGSAENPIKKIVFMRTVLVQKIKDTIVVWPLRELSTGDQIISIDFEHKDKEKKVIGGPTVFYSAPATVLGNSGFDVK